MAQAVRVTLPIDRDVKARSFIDFFVDECDGNVDENRRISRTRVRPRGAMNHSWNESGWLQGQWLEPSHHGGWLEGLWLMHEWLTNEDTVSHVVGPFYGPAGANGYMTMRAKLYDPDSRTSATTAPDVEIPLDTDPTPPTGFRSYSVDGQTLNITGSASTSLERDDGVGH